MGVMRVLLSIVGDRDPFSIDRETGAREPGPILTLATEREFDAAYLYHTADDSSRKRAGITEAELRNVGRGTAVTPVELQVTDPTSHFQLISALRPQLNGLRDRSGAAEYFISIASGTPAMHAVWMLLAASDEIHANILYIRPRRFVTSDQPLIGEINPRAPEFPQISRRVGLQDVAVAGSEEINAIARKLGIVGADPKLNRSLDEAARFALFDFPVLLQGESGTGKELFARFIHKTSKRGQGKFVAVNCAAVATTLAESELFGHVKGAYTDAKAAKDGAFVEADGGTLFLDEIGDMPLEIQAKILRAIQEREVRPVGADACRKVDVRIISATHRNLRQMVGEGRFRLDLLERLNTLPVNIPALRDRGGDIPSLALSLLTKLNNENRTRKTLSLESLNVLRGHCWPGNIRELENVVKRAFALCSGDEIGPEHLVIDRDTSCPSDEPSLPELGNGFSLEEYISSLRSDIYEAALARTGGRQAEAARLLGVSPQSVSKFLGGSTHYTK